MYTCTAKKCEIRFQHYSGFLHIFAHVKNVFGPTGTEVPIITLPLLCHFFFLKKGGSQFAKERIMAGRKLKRQHAIVERSATYSKRPRLAAKKTRMYTVKNERKGVDKRIDESDIGNSNGLAIMGSLNAIVAGPGSYQRTGRKIKMKSLRLKGVAYYSVDSATEIPRDVCLRILMVYDKQSNGTSATVADVVVATDNGGTENNTYFSNQLGYDDMERFVVVMDKIVHLKQGGNGSGAAGLSISCPLDEFIDLKGMETTYNQDGAATNAAIQTGNLRIGFVTDVNTGTNSSVQFVGVARLRYYD